jgi:hypothetical protein
LGYTGANFGTLAREQHNSKMCRLQWNDLEHAETTNLYQMLRAVIKRERQYDMVMSTPLKAYT